MTYDFTPIMDAARVSEQSQNTVIRLLVQALEQLEPRVRQLEARLDCLSDAMTARNNQLEARLDRLSDLTVGESDQPFDEQVLQVLRVRSGSAREALEVLGNDCEFDSRVLSVIEDNSFTVYTHIEAEIEGKLDDMTQSYAFSEAVEDAVKGSIVSTVEDVIADLGVIDAEEIVRTGLRAII